MFKNNFMVRKVRSTSDGFHGTSKWCKAINLVCTFMPAPHFAVLPMSTRT